LSFFDERDPVEHIREVGAPHARGATDVAEPHFLASYDAGRCRNRTAPFDYPAHPLDPPDRPDPSPGKENCMLQKWLVTGTLWLVLTVVPGIPAVAVDARPDPAQKVPPAVSAPEPAGAYTLDPAHASLIFRVNHLGFSNYTARFKRFDASLKFDPKDLAASTVVATVDTDSLETDYPDPAKLDFNAQLKGAQWLNVAQFPTMEFRSRRVEVTGANAVRIHGDLTLHGVTRPVVLAAKFNGGYAGHPMDPHARIGFSARATLQRSAFGIAYGIPAPGTTMGVGDDVDIVIEAEFTGPPLVAARTP
jgi:polyisoprenoid-binding protein YceI